MNSDVRLLREAVLPLTGAPSDFDALVARARNARVVLLGEASHGTHEFYRVRAEITKRLIQELGFNAVAVEADWPDAYRINRFVRGASTDAEAVEALVGFERFPQWMWRNTDVLDFIGWLRNWNESVIDHDRKSMSTCATEAGFYGLDLYSLNASITAVIEYLKPIDPSSARLMAEHYGCFDHFGGDTQRYGLLAGYGISGDCQREVLEALVQLHSGRKSYLGHNGIGAAADEFFNAEQNARVIKHAEEYYRAMFRRDVSSWNLRDRHMMHTLLLLMQHLFQTHDRAKVVIWAHNSHLGNAAATSMGTRGEFNLGQLVREHFGNEALAVGFTTHHGTVTAASDWNGPTERKKVRRALPESYETLFHATEVPRFWLDCQTPEVTGMLRKPRLERAIGVIYCPDTERTSHYFEACLPEQFDAIFHYDETRAVEPLERTTQWAAGEVEETYPSGL